MGLHSELYLTISIASMSVIITIITTIAALFVTTYFYGKQKQEIIIRKLRHHESSRSKSRSNEANQKSAPNKGNHIQQNDQPVISTSPRSISMSPKSISKSPRANTTENSIKNHSESVNDRDKDIGSYFKFTASVTLIFSAFNAFFNSWYCIWLLFDPAYDDPMFYVQHPSHIHRITSTGIYQFT